MDEGQASYDEQLEVETGFSINIIIPSANHNTITIAVKIINYNDY